MIQKEKIITLAMDYLNQQKTIAIYEYCYNPVRSDPAKAKLFSD